MDDADRAGRLIEAIYDAALDASQWEGALTLLADFLGADDAALGAACAGEIPWLAAPRTDPDRLAAYGEYGGDDLVWQRIVGRGPGTVACDGMLTTAEELRRNRFQQEWSLPQGYRHKLGAFVDGDDGWLSVLVCPSRSAFERDDKDKLAALVPHLRRALLIGRQLGRIESLAELAERAVADPLRPALVLDAAGAVLQAGPAAEPWFAEGLRLAEGQLAVAGREGERLRALLAGRNGVDGIPGDEVRLPSGRRLRVVPLGTAAARRGPGQPAAILTGVPLTRDEQVSLLRYRYRLTAAEAQLAIEMRRGDGRHAAAARRGIGYATARTHLSRIFDKLGVARQGELVATLERVLV